MDSFDGMQWFNEPPEWSVAEGVLRVRTARSTDFWRTTHYDFVRGSGHLFYKQVEGDFRASARFHGDFNDLYDQAGLMIWADENSWIKAGVELLNGELRFSVVATNTFSDWSVHSIADSPEIVVAMAREGDSVTIEFGAANEPTHMARLAYFPPNRAVRVGPMCCSPDGQGFAVSFTNFDLTTQ